MKSKSFWPSFIPLPSPLPLLAPYVVLLGGLGFGPYLTGRPQT